MGLKPWEFDRLTPNQFAAMAAGYRKRVEQEWYRVAWLACYMLAPHTKKKLTPEKLLGKPAQRSTRIRRDLRVEQTGVPSSES